MSFFLINTIQQCLLKSKARVFGLNYNELNSVGKWFGLPITWKSNIPFSKIKKNSYVFVLSKADKSVKNLVLVEPIKFNSNLRKFISKRISFLKLNRTLRGVRHSQFLPVRGQRTKTNAKTQKSRRRN